MVSTQPPTSVTIPFEADRHRVDLGAVQLEVEEHGSGEPVLLIHAALLADWFSPLLAQSNLRERYRLVSYHRVGFAGSCTICLTVQLRAALGRDASCAGPLQHVFEM